MPKTKSKKKVAPTTEYATEYKPILPTGNWNPPVIAKKYKPVLATSNPEKWTPPMIAPEYRPVLPTGESGSLFNMPALPGINPNTYLYG